MGGLLEQPALAIELGAKLLAENMARTGGSVADSLSAYNGGFRPSLGFGVPLNGRYGNQLYVDRVLANYQYFQQWEAMKRGAPSPLPWLAVAAIAAAIGWKMLR
jgi:hypothetical protein